MIDIEINQLKSMREILNLQVRQDYISIEFGIIFSDIIFKIMETEL